MVFGQGDRTQGQNRGSVGEVLWRRDSQGDFRMPCGAATTNVRNMGKIPKRLKRMRPKLLTRRRPSSCMYIPWPESQDLWILYVSKFKV